MHDNEGSEFDRLFYPFLFEGGKASLEDVLAQVRHSTLEKSHEVIELRRMTLENSIAVSYTHLTLPTILRV